MNRKRISAGPKPRFIDPTEEGNRKYNAEGRRRLSEVSQDGALKIEKNERSVARSGDSNATPSADRGDNRRYRRMLGDWLNTGCVS